MIWANANNRKKSLEVLLIVAVALITMAFRASPADAAESCQGNSGAGPITGNDTAILVKPNREIAINPLRLAHDPDGCRLTIVKLSTPQWGTAKILQYVPSGTPGPQTSTSTVFYVYGGRFTPATDTFSYTIKNSRGQTATGQITVLLYQTLRPPIAADLTLDTIAGGGLRINVVAQSSDPDGGSTGWPLRVVEISGLDENAVEVFLSIYYGDTVFGNALRSGTTSFYYRLYSDATGLSSIGKITLNSRIARPPIAPDYVVTTRPGHQVEINVLSRASDPDAINYESEYYLDYSRARDKYIWLLGIDTTLTPPIPGQVLVSDHSLYVTPNAHFTGPIILYYRIRSNFFRGFAGKFLAPIAIGKVTVNVVP